MVEPEQQPAPATGPTPEVLTAIGARRPPASDGEEVARVARLPLLAAALAVVAAWVVLSLWGLGAAPFHTKGEPREALVVWEMTHGSSLVLPLRNGTELPSKPPLLHWLGALTATVRGELDEWSVRFPSALASLLGSLLVLVAGSMLWSVRAGLVAALVLLTSFEWSRAATTGRVDMVLTLGLELAFVSLLLFLRRRNPRWLVPLYLGISLSILGKGPVGAVLPGLLAIVVCLLSRDVTPLQQMRLLRGTIAVAVLGGSWYALAWREGGYDFFYKQVLDENVFRFLGSDKLSGGHRHPAWRLYLLLLVGLLPWTLFVPPIAARLWRDRRSFSAQDGVGFLLLWIVVVVGFFSIPASKRSVYLLALYPAAALIVGWWVDTTMNGSANERWLRRVLAPAAPLAAAFGVVLVIATAGFAVGVPIDAWLAAVLKPRDALVLSHVATALRANATVALCSAVVLALAAVLLLWITRRPRPLAAFVCLFTIAAAANVFTRQAVLPAVAEAKTPRDLMRAARAHVPPDHTLFFHATFDYGAVFYWDGHIPRHEGRWPLDAPPYLLVRRSFWDRERARAIRQYDVARDADGTPLQSAALVLIERQTEAAD
jgi:4-amino-4-deoxy-L-arabinose transferase-like glycosyltransferase